MIIQGTSNQHFSEMMSKKAYLGIVRTRILELERLQEEGKITNLKVKNRTIPKKDWFVWLKRPTHRYSTVITHCANDACFHVHMMRPESEKEITFLVPRAKAEIQESPEEITINI